jgi:hypothetical protein
MAREWILLEFHLHDRAQTSEATPQVCETRCNPDLCASRKRDHPSKDSNTTRNEAGSAAPWMHIRALSSSI